MLRSVQQPCRDGFRPPEFLIIRVAPSAENLEDPEMPVLPWTTPPAVTGPDGDVVVMATRLNLAAYRYIPAFMRAAMAVRRQVLRSSGALGVSLDAHPLSRRFYTLSAWHDQPSLDAFVRAAPHRDVMRRFGPRLRNPVFLSWTVPAGSLPVPWSEARRRLDERQPVQGPG